MRNRLFVFLCAALAACATAARAEIKVVADRNAGGDAAPAFKFERVPPPAKTGAAGKFTVVDGEADGNGGGPDKLNDGQLPTEEDQPAENFFFNADTPGGRLRLDLNQVKTIQQINTYSWHPNTRGPQVYKLYASKGTEAGFNAQPKRGTDPATCGWTMIASVDTRPIEGPAGGQYGVSITDSAGAVGDYRYLLFDCSTTETDDGFGNTFYSEINVLGPGEIAPAKAGGEKREIKVITGRSTGDDATAAFKINGVPRPAKTGTAGKFTVVDGEIDGASGGLEKLNDGRMPTEEDQPDENFFFNADTPGGRLRLDLNKVKTIQQINTYSWHPNTRGPQVYKLYGATGTEPGFNAEPKHDTAPAACGWTFITSVDTRPKDGEPGGQYGVSIRAASGALGDYRYLLFDCSATERDDPFGNTFYNEINVLGPDEVAPAGAPSGNATPAGQKPYVTRTPDGKYEITFDTSSAPEMAGWVSNKLAPALLAWYPKIVAYLPSEGYEAPRKFTVTLRPGDGVADTAGTRVNAYLPWLKRSMSGEGIGALVHECVHVVQQYGATRHRDGPRARNPSYLVEGIADYYRWFKFEPQSKGAEISRRRLRRANYDGSYRITANFLNWVSEKYDKDLVPQLNAAMREGNYSVDLWTKSTGKTVEQLNTEWKDDLKKRIEGVVAGGS
jgi:uncharacterized protein (DUF2249 family)